MTHPQSFPILELSKLLQTALKLSLGQQEEERMDVAKVNLCSTEHDYVVIKVIVLTGQAGVSKLNDNVDVKINKQNSKI